MDHEAEARKLTFDRDMASEIVALIRRALPPQDPTEAMLIATREWSLAEYGKPIGNDAARGCWAAMLAAAKQEE